MGANEYKQSELACDFWIGMEYLNLCKAEDADERWIFNIESEDDMPWKHPKRQSVLLASGNKYKAQIAYCGLYDKSDFTVSLRTLLQAKPMDAKEMRKGGDGAVLLIPLDFTGRVCGEVFISSMPWFMGRLSAHLAVAGARGSPDLSGFEDYQEALMEKVKLLLVQMQIIREEASTEDSAIQQKQITKSGSEDKLGSLRDGKISGQRDMKVLEVDHIRELLDLIWKTAGWKPSWGPYLQADGQQHLVRIKVISMVRNIDKKIEFNEMNSLIVNDVVRVRQQITEKKNLGLALSQYLKLHPDPNRIDLRDGNESGGLGTFIGMLAPDRLPQGAWPDFPLVAAQQFAVNMSRQHLLEGGLYGVNGPPGTGKSTLLRDVVADRLVDRAALMASFPNPEKAFIQKCNIDGAQYGDYYTLDDRLLGHGIAIVSSNNGAVENVIKDLPKLTGPMRDNGLTYFTKVSDTIAEESKESIRPTPATWGLVAALLGKGDNKNAFFSRFWFDSGPKQDINEELDPNRRRSLVSLITGGDHGARAWNEVVPEFTRAREMVNQRASRLKEVIDLCKQVKVYDYQLKTLLEKQPMLHSTYANHRDKVMRIEAEHDGINRELNAYLDIISARTNLDCAKEELASASAASATLPTPQVTQANAISTKEDYDAARRHTETVKSTKPKMLDYVLDWRISRSWPERMQAAAVDEKIAYKNNSAAKKISAQVDIARSRELKAQGEMTSFARLEEKATRIGSNLGCRSIFNIDIIQVLKSQMILLREEQSEADDKRIKSLIQVKSLEKEVAFCQGQISLKKNRISQLDAELGNLKTQFYDTVDLLAMNDEDLQRVVPYNDAELRRLRIEVFRLSMLVNESFVVAAWKRLKPTLSAFINYQQGKLSQAQVGDASVHLWNAFFMVVPVVSSSFASVGKLFAGLGSEQLGLLLIDEAGQAAPQNAVGAIWRSRRVLAVGDPKQLEPVVPLPTTAISAWREWLGANKDWTPPSCSTQVLADRVTPYGTTMNSDEAADRQLWVGSPLRVHRRCLNPMFVAANEIAYSGLMVHGVEDKTGHNNWLGHSQWFDVDGESQGHWIKSQGEFTIDLIDKLLKTKEINGELKNNKGEWHINIITPYKAISTAFKAMLGNSFQDVVDVKKMAGTVHTFQGKEADIVILLLGGDPDKAGAVASFAGNEESPNLLNVALTRAKKRIYVVGAKKLWTNNSGTFRRLADLLTDHEKTKNSSRVADMAQQIASSVFE